MPDGAQSSPVAADIGNLIFQKMPLILAEIGHIGKDKTNTQQKFKYRGIDDCYLAIHSLLAKHKVFMTAKILEKSREERRSTRTDGTTSILAFTCLTMRYRFYAEDGSWVDTEAEGEGMDSGDKSSNKAMSVAQKYSLIQAFCIPTEGISDPDQETHEVAPRQDDKSDADWAIEAGSWINQQTDPAKINQAWTANLDRFFSLPAKLQANLQKMRDDKLVALTAKGAEPEGGDRREAWVNSSISWIDEQVSLTDVQKFWKTNAAAIRALAADQLAALERAKENATRRITALSSPRSSANTPINLDDAIPF